MDIIYKFEYKKMKYYYNLGKEFCKYLLKYRLSVAKINSNRPNKFKIGLTLYLDSDKVRECYDNNSDNDVYSDNIERVNLVKLLSIIFKDKLQPDLVFKDYNKYIDIMRMFFYKTSIMDDYIKDTNINKKIFSFLRYIKSKYFLKELVKYDEPYFYNIALSCGIYSVLGKSYKHFLFNDHKINIEFKNICNKPDVQKFNILIKLS